MGTLIWIGRLSPTVRRCRVSAEGDRAGERGSLAMDSHVPFPPVTSAIWADGAFAFADIRGGTYLFVLEKDPSGVVLRGVRCGGGAVTAAMPLRIGDRQQVLDCEAELASDGSSPRAQHSWFASA